MLFDVGLQKCFWAEAVNIAAYVVDRSINSILKTTTPNEVSDVMVHVPQAKRLKWDPKSSKILFVGYCDDTMGYRCIVPDTKKLVISRDVFFIEKNLNSTIEIDVADETDAVRENSTSEAAVTESGKVYSGSEEVESDEQPEKVSFQSFTDTDSSLDDTIVDESYNPDVVVAPPTQLRRSER